jgi:hypothetical protein
MRVKTNFRASRRAAASLCIPSSLTGGFKARCRFAGYNEETTDPQASFGILEDF